MTNSIYQDLTIQVSGQGSINSIRGIELPDGILYAPVQSDDVNLIPASAMRAMTAALELAGDIQQRADRQVLEQGE